MAIDSPDPGTPPPPKTAIFYQKRIGDNNYGPAVSWSGNYDYYNPTVSTHNSGQVTVMWESYPHTFRAFEPIPNSNSFNTPIIEEGLNPNLASNELRYAFLSNGSPLYNLNVQPVSTITPPPPPPPPHPCPIDVESMTASRSANIQSGSDNTSLKIILREPKLFGGSCTPQKIPFDTIDGSININSVKDMVEYFKTKTFTISTTSCANGESGYDSLRISGKITVKNPNGLIEPGTQAGKLKFVLIDATTGEHLMRLGSEVLLENTSKIRFNFKVSIANLEGRTVYIKPKFVGSPKNNLSGNIMDNNYIVSSAIPDCISAKANLNDGKSDKPAALPAEYGLSQNYPNPFNPTTVINYQLPENGHVTLKVYDVLGKEVATIINENKEAGYYEASFDASRLSSGVYFYKLVAGSFVKTNKMLLAR